MHHKRGKPKRFRSACKLCKPFKQNGIGWMSIPANVRRNLPEVSDWEDETTLNGIENSRYDCECCRDTGCSCCVPVIYSTHGDGWSLIGEKDESRRKAS
jgi:hypothetical protein